MKSLRLLLPVLLLCSLCAAPLRAQDLSAKQERKQKIEQEIRFLDKQLKNLGVKHRSTTEHLTLVQKKVSARKSLLNRIDSQIHDVDAQIAEKKADIARTQAELDTLGGYYDRLVYNAYKNRDTKVWFMYVLGSESVGQGYRRLTYFKNLSDAVGTQADRIRETRARLEQEQASLEESRRQLVALRGQREKEYKELVSDQKQSQSLIKRIAKDQKKYRKDLAAKRKEVENLNRQIAKMVASTVAADKRAKDMVDPTLSGEFAQNRGKLGWPVNEGVITDRFGVHYHPVYKNIRLPENNGITISTNAGAEVFSVFDGVVKQIVVIPGYNQCVLIQHGKYYTFYCKLAGVSVKPRQKVRTGESIGYLQEDGNVSTIHFQIWDGTVKQDPEKWLKK